MDQLGKDMRFGLRMIRKSPGFWQNRFGEDSNIIGRSIRLDPSVRQYRVGGGGCSGMLHSCPQSDAGGSLGGAPA